MFMPINVGNTDLRVKMAIESDWVIREYSCTWIMCVCVMCIPCVCMCVCVCTHRHIHAKHLML